LDLTQQPTTTIFPQSLRRFPNREETQQCLHRLIPDLSFPSRVKAKGAGVRTPDMLQTYLQFLVLHACFTAIALCFVYTSWHFYAFSGTNLLTRCHSLFFAVFLFQIITEGNILGIGQNKSQSAYFPDAFTESKRETETGNELATPGSGAGPLLAVPPHGVGPSSAH
jgi:hypothetical protein